MACYVGNTDSLVERLANILSGSRPTLKLSELFTGDKAFYCWMIEAL